MIAFREGVSFRVETPEKTRQDREIEAEVDRLIAGRGFSDTLKVRENVRQHVLRELGVLPPLPKRTPTANRLRANPAGALERLEWRQEARAGQAEAERRKKRRTEGTARGPIRYDFAPLPDVWVRHMARYFPPKADRLLCALFMFWRNKRECWPSIRQLAELTGYSTQTIQDLLSAFAYCRMLRIGKKPSGDRKVKRRNLYVRRGTCAWHIDRAKEVTGYLRELRAGRKTRTPETLAVTESAGLM